MTESKVHLCFKSSTTAFSHPKYGHGPWDHHFLYSVKIHLTLTSTSELCCDQLLLELEHTFIFTLDTLYTLYTLYTLFNLLTGQGLVGVAI